jgi:hypothetical protein
MMNAQNPQWANAAQTLIDCEIEHPIFGVIPFTASPDDVEEHGREIFARAFAGEFGTVADYVPPPAPVANKTTAQSVPME